MSAWPCAWCGRTDMDTVAWGFTFDARAACLPCVELHDIPIHDWRAANPKRAVTDFGEATINDDEGTVKLGWPLMRRAVYVGVDRRMSALQKGRHNAHGFKGTTAWDVDIEGAAAELAACVWLGLPWEPVVGALDTDIGDLGDGRQVRSTPWRSGHLLLHDTDHDDHRFVLVTGRAPELTIVGWCLGSEGKVQEFWLEPEAGRPCFMVPQEVLRPVPRWVASRPDEAPAPAAAATPAEGPGDSPRRPPQGPPASARDLPGVSDDRPY